METIITDTNFNAEVVESELPVLIDFWAEWCGPCRMLAPVIEKIAEEYEGRLKVCKVNVDEQDRLAGAFSVNSIPLLVLLKKGQVVDSTLGYRPLEQVKLLLQDNGI